MIVVDNKKNTMQHIIVGIVFAVCIYLIARRIMRIVSRAKKGDAKCHTCTETSCPLHEAYETKKCCHETTKVKKNVLIAKNCKKTQP